VSGILADGINCAHIWHIAVISSIIVFPCPINLFGLSGLDLRSSENKAIALLGKVQKRVAIIIMKNEAYAELISIGPALRLRSPFDFAQGEEINLHAERRRGIMPPQS